MPNAFNSRSIAGMPLPISQYPNVEGPHRIRIDKSSKPTVLEAQFGHQKSLRVRVTRDLVVISAVGDRVLLKLKIADLVRETIGPRLRRQQKREDALLEWVRAKPNRGIMSVHSPPKPEPGKLFTHEVGGQKCRVIL